MEIPMTMGKWNAPMSQEARQRKSEATTAAWADPETRQRLIEGRRRYMRDPANHGARSAASRKSAQTKRDRKTARLMAELRLEHEEQMTQNEQNGHRVVTDGQLLEQARHQEIKEMGKSDIPRVTTRSSVDAISERDAHEAALAIAHYGCQGMLNSFPGAAFCQPDIIQGTSATSGPFAVAGTPTTLKPAVDVDAAQHAAVQVAIVGAQAYIAARRIISGGGK
jgi:hypothetical protein